MGDEHIHLSLISAFARSLNPYRTLDVDWVMSSMSVQERYAMDFRWNSQQELARQRIAKEIKQ